MKMRGFTLVELVMVIIITGVLAAALTVFMKPAIDSYFDTRRRADLTDMADTALRRMSQDIRSAVPNSIRSVTASCFQLVPTIAGGRYRMDMNTAATPGTWIDTSTVTTDFDVLSPLWDVTNPPPLLPVAVGDWVVIDNQNGDDVYSDPSPARARITGFVTAPLADVGVYQHRITVATKQFPTGYDGGRFVVVPDNSGRPAVVYACVGTGVDAEGNGTGKLYRATRAFFAAPLTTCALDSGAVVATDVSSCTFVYDPNHGATQQSGFVWMRLELSRADESIALAHGVHVDNVP